MGTEERDIEKIIEKYSKYSLKSPQERYPYAFKGLRIKNIVCLVASVMLFLAIFNLPYGYYILLRWVVAAVALGIGLAAIGFSRWPWVFIMFIILLVYSPISLSDEYDSVIYLNRRAWGFVDLICMSLFIAAIFDVSPRSESDYRSFDFACRELFMSKAERERITREHLEHELKGLMELRKQPEFKGMIFELDKDIEELTKKLGYKK